MIIAYKFQKPNTRTKIAQTTNPESNRQATLNRSQRRPNFIAHFAFLCSRLYLRQKHLQAPPLPTIPCSVSLRRNNF
jgi:hypothetical protein